MEFKKHFHRRSKTSHKGDYGRVFILAGSQGMSGACYMASMAALRSGAGLVTVGVPKSLVSSLSRKMTEAMMKGLPETKAGTLSRGAYKQVGQFLKTQDVLALGPGLSQNSETQMLVRKIISNAKLPMIIDADALNALKGNANLLKRMKATAVLTPHPGEFVRLFGGPVPKSDAERKKRALSAAKKFKIHLVLKGHHTVVASPSGEVYVNQTGNPGMATGGSGDVLTGVVAALLGQKLNPFLAACFAVYVHGFAGDLAAKKKGEISLVAGDLLDFLPAAFLKILK